MANTIKKKDRERYQLERFQAIFRGFPKGKVVDGKDNGLEPDFFVEQANAILGIELTEMYREIDPAKRPMRADESVRKQIVDRARELFEQNGGPILDVSVHFSMNEEWRKRLVAQLAPRIEKIISDNVLSIGEHAWLHNPWTNPDYFPFEIESISVIHTPNRLRSHWTCPEASSVPEFSEREIQSAVDKKNSRIVSYRHRAPDAVWLLILRGLSGMSSTFDLSSRVSEHKYVFDFDRVFLFDWFSQTYVELHREH